MEDPEQINIWRERCQSWMNMNERPWIAAARKALAGDMADLRERVEILGPFIEDNEHFNDGLTL